MHRSELGQLRLQGRCDWVITSRECSVAKAAIAGSSPTKDYKYILVQPAICYTLREPLLPHRNKYVTSDRFHLRKRNNNKRTKKREWETQKKEEEMEQKEGVRGEGWEGGGCRSALPFLYCCYSVIKTVLVCFSAVSSVSFAERVSVCMCEVGYRGC